MRTSAILDGPVKRRDFFVLTLVLGLAWSMVYVLRSDCLCCSLSIHPRASAVHSASNISNVSVLSIPCFKALLILVLLWLPTFVVPTTKRIRNFNIRIQAAMRASATINEFCFKKRNGPPRWLFWSVLFTQFTLEVAHLHDLVSNACSWFRVLPVWAFVDLRAFQCRVCVCFSLVR